MHLRRVAILSQASIDDIRIEWNGVEVMLEKMQSLTSVTFATGAITGPAVGKVLYNLPLLLAADVLCKTLRLAKTESLFSSNKSSLGALVKTAKDILDWENWDNIWLAVTNRNAIAHDGELFDSQVCTSAIQDIKSQLLLWRIL